MARRGYVEATLSSVSDSSSVGERERQAPDGCTPGDYSASPENRVVRASPDEAAPSEPVRTAERAA